MLKDFFVRKMLESKLKELPESERGKVMKILEENPDFFMNIANEIQTKVRGGKDQMAAAMEVMQMHQDELKKLLGQ